MRFGDDSASVRALRRASVLVFSIVLAPHALAAPPQVDSLFPAGGGRGRKVSVTAAGNFGHWPASVWTDREGLVIEPQSEKGKFKIAVSDDAAAGVYYLRFYDAEGASSLRPFLVDSLPEVNEKEPNNEVVSAHPVDQSTIVNGRLQSNGDVDGFRMTLEKGQTLVASLQGKEPLGSPMDAVLQICDGDGFILEQNDDARGIDPQIVFTAPQDGEYLVRTFAFPETANSSIRFSGAANYVYRLTLTTSGFVDHTLPLAVNQDQPGEVELCGWNIPESAVKQKTVQSAVAFHADVASSVHLQATSYSSITEAASAANETPQPITVPCVLTGRIAKPHEADVFRFTATKGQKIRIRVEADSLGFRLDPLVQVLAADGKVLAEVDDTSRQRDCELTQTIPADGPYQLRIRDAYGHGGFRYVYRATIAEAVPDFALKLEADSFVLTPGKPLEIPVVIERQNGFAEEIEVLAAGLPDGVQFDAAKSAAKGDSSKSVKLILTAEAGARSTPFQIVGQASGGTKHTARFAVGGVKAEHTKAWLTVLKKK